MNTLCHRLLLYISVILFSVNTSSAQKKYIYQNKRSQPVVETKSVNPTATLPNSTKKDIYRIDILLPLHLDNLPTTPQYLSSIPSESIVGAHLYEGLLLAIDSLEKQGKMYYDIFIHDIGKVPFDDIVNNNNFHESDLIIGAVQSAEIPTIAQYAFDRQINFMSILSPATAGVNSNPYFIITQPTLETHIRNLTQYTERNRLQYRPIIFYTDEPGDDIAFTNYKSLIKRRHYELKISGDHIDMNQLLKSLSKTQPNLIYTTFLNPNKATKIIEQLNTLSPEYKIEIVGMPSWKGAPILTDSSLNNNISILIPHVHRFDVEVDKRLYLRQLYAKYNRGLPSELVFKGFETILYATELLSNYGNYFNLNLGSSVKSYSTQYDMKYQYSEQRLPLYYENVHSYIYRYHNGTLNIVQQ